MIGSARPKARRIALTSGQFLDPSQLWAAGSGPIIISSLRQFPVFGPALYGTARCKVRKKKDTDCQNVVTTMSKDRLFGWIEHAF